MALEDGISLRAAIGWAAGATVPLIAMLSVAVYYFPAYLCANRMGPTVASPDRRHRAVVFERDCGGPTPMSTQISIMRHDEALGDGDAGNAYMSTPDLTAPEGDAPRGMWGGPWVALRWTDDRHLLITRHPHQSDDFVAPSVDGVRIRVVAAATQR